MARIEKCWKLAAFFVYNGGISTGRYSIMASHKLAVTGLLALLSVMLLACGAKQEAPVREVIRPVKTIMLEEAAGMTRKFPASIESSRRVELSFRVPGKLSDLLIQEGDKVQAGQLLAVLDPTDYQLALEDAEAESARARGDWERAKVLVVDGHLSRTDFDHYESVFQRALAALEQARLNLSYTELKAPIGGTIARRYIQNFEELAAKQEIIALRDNSELEVRVDVPEQIMSLLALNYAEGKDEGLWVSFPAAGEQRFELRTKEIATRADPKTQTFQARMTFAAPKQLNVLPGMSAVVTADLELMSADTLQVSLPATAVDQRQGQTRLWLYQPETGTAVPRAVTIGPLVGDNVEIIEGLEMGDRIVVAGVGSLNETMKLYEMRKVEQAK
jgi:RND family efflux transporter MFP subunit